MRSGEIIPDSLFIQDDLGLVQVLPDLLTKMLHMHLDAVVCLREIIPPHEFGKRSVGEYIAPVFHEFSEDQALGMSNLDLCRSVPTAHRSRRGFNNEVQHLEKQEGGWYSK